MTLQIASNLECFSLPRVIFARILKRFCCLPSKFHFEWTVKLGDVCSHLADTRGESLGLFSSDDVASKPRLYEQCSSQKSPEERLCRLVELQTNERPSF